MMMRRIERWMAPLVLCTVAACAAPKDRVGLDGFEKPGEDITELTRERGVEGRSQTSDEARLTKWERVAGHSQRRNVGPSRRSRGYLPLHEARGSRVCTIYDPQSRISVKTTV